MSVINKRYEVLECIGKGGMGEVFKVRDLLNRHQIQALKKIKKKIVDDAVLLSFKHEFDIMSRLKHPNLIRVYDFGRDGDTGEYYITMEYLRGKQLIDIINEASQPDMNTILSIMVNTCRALAFIHARNILHRDINPHNILVTGDAAGKITRITVMDFGLADLIEPGIKRMEQVKGTLAYFSPEVTAKKADKRTDIYALGITFYELLAGKLFYSDLSQQHIINILLNEHEFNGIKQEKLGALRNEQLAGIIDKMTAYYPEDRYTLCSQIIHDINRVMHTSFDVETNDTRIAYILGAGFVGRYDEMNRLKEHLNRGPDTYKALRLVGDAGVGKSRLFEEFKKYCRLNGIDFLTGDCYKDRYLNPFIPMLDELLLHAQKAIISRYGPELVKISPRHMCLQDITPAPVLEGQAEHDKLVKSISAFIVETCRHKKSRTILYFNDLHEADNTSVMIIDDLIQRISPDDSIRIYLSGRKMGEDIFEEMRSKDAIDLLHLSPFDEKTIVAYIEAIFGVDTIGTGLWKAIPEIRKKVGGNPFYLQELIKDIVQTRKLDYPDSTWELTGNFTDIDIPDTVSGLVLSRLERLNLTPKERKIPEIISLLNREVGYRELNLIIPVDPALLTFLTDNELLSVKTTANDMIYKPAHDLIRDTIISRIENVGSLHALIAERLEHIYRDECDRHSEELADHYFKAGNNDKAIHYLTRAGFRAKNNYENKKALILFNKLLSLLDDTLMDKKIDILLDKGTVLELLGDYRGGIDVLVQAEYLAEKSGDKARQAKANERLSYAYDLVEDTDLLEMAVTKKALALYRELGDKAGICSMLAGIGFLYLSRDQEKARAYLEEGLQLALTNNFDDLTARFYDYLSRLLHRRGQFKKAIEYLKKAVLINEAFGNKRSTAIGYVQIGINYKHLKQYRQALHAYDTSLHIAEDIEYSALIILNVLEKIEVLIQLKKYDTAGKMLSHLNVYLCENDILVYRIASNVLEARIKAGAGNKEEAEHILQALLDAGHNMEEISDLTEINYELWKITGKEEYRREALKIISERNNKSPAFYYTMWINELKTGT